jgi:pimeloyl-ACP methyl ester carboxylesterase
MPSLTVGDAKIWYETAGHGPPVVLIQGVGVAGRAWEPQVQALRDRFELAWFDNRGIGRSTGEPTSVERMAADVVALLDHLGWERAHIVGHSLGGVIAQELALSAPERVLSLALLCTFSRGRNVIRFDLRSLAMNLRVRLGTQAMRRRAFFDMVSPRSLSRQAEVEPHIVQLEQAFERGLADLPPAAMAQVLALRAHDKLDQLPALSGIPSVVVSATEDPLAPPSEGRALAAALGAPFHELPGSHAITVQDPESINELLVALWGGLPSSERRDLEHA